jgi:hypothetical protein
MSKFLPCKSVCPVVSELRKENELLKSKLELGQKRNVILTQSKRGNEKRIAKIRQATLGIVDWGIED